MKKQKEFDYTYQEDSYKYRVSLVTTFIIEAWKGSVFYRFYKGFSKLKPKKEVKT